ncbi:hypothetical protein N9H93_00590 [Rhizobiaceae bacterium]|nr:hypothetical protein [Rhizobiaceae bacterium]
MLRFRTLLLILFAALMPVEPKANAQTMGTYCEHATGGCFGVPQPMGSVCHCGNLAGKITG